MYVQTKQTYKINLHDAKRPDHLSFKYKFPKSEQTYRGQVIH